MKICDNGIPDPDNLSLYSKTFRDFFHQCVRMNPEERPTMAELLEVRGSCIPVTMIEGFVKHAVSVCEVVSSLCEGFEMPWGRCLPECLKCNNDLCCSFLPL